MPNRNPTGAYRPENDAPPGNRKLIRPTLTRSETRADGERPLQREARARDVIAGSRRDATRFVNRSRQWGL